MATVLEELLRSAANYQHTLREIQQQPVTWPGTAATMLAAKEIIEPLVSESEWLVFTGSGSSEYAGNCVAPAIRRDLKRTSVTHGGGWLLTEQASALPKGRGLVVSLARSGDSPESSGVLDLLLESAPDVRHLIITCNPEGKLVSKHAANPRVKAITLDERTNDRSLVMTSSFTNMVVAARALGRLNGYTATVNAVAEGANRILSSWMDPLLQVSVGEFQRVLYLGSGCQFGAAKESALKMLEMTAARVVTMAETYLGLRHGPMSFANDRTLVVCYLSSDPMIAAYEADLIEELNRKRLGWRKILVGESVPRGLAKEDDLVLEHRVDSDIPVLDVLVGQILAFGRCLNEGLSPDSPSEDGVISRVVNGFVLHRRPEVTTIP